MKILLIGSGGREHALAWKLKQSPLCDDLFIAPGNAGTALCGTNLSIGVSDFERLGAACMEHGIEMVLVGPEEPLVNGIYDYFKSKPGLDKIKLIGPSKEASQLEGSKAFAKSFMKKHGIPTAAYAEFSADTYMEGVNYIKAHALPIVLKADGLAAGKGVLICQHHLEAMSEFDLMLHRAKFGEAGKRVVIEEFLKGIELSMFVLTDGDHYILLPEAKDYKRVGAGDTGLNTGGMGAVSPLPFVDDAFLEKVKKQVIEPTIAGLKQDRLEYKGFIFLGLMNDNGDPKVIEYNCRLGDPETEVVIPRIKSDLVEILMATSEKRLHEISLDIDDRSAATVVAVSGGYPGDYKKGKEISGLEETSFDDTIVFLAGTKREGSKVLTNGGRVLAVTSFGSNITEAAEQSNYMMEQLFFEDMYFRPDIGYEFKAVEN
ncbi:MAG TPA: phosphoribosylamine--glycine ligase [Ferruginibacter sp.]|nr:phosphoribosylamine--glycine ligase [Chitinophagaceae bacterium]HRI25179.1 phosphoribosylamine--glycine ligase [Ferruginibacter sp.]